LRAIDSSHNGPIHLLLIGSVIAGFHNPGGQPALKLLEQEMGGAVVVTGDLESRAGTGKVPKGLLLAGSHGHSPVGV